MRKTNSAAEPSMEEILASIRQIIEQSDSAQTPQRPLRPVPTAPRDDDFTLRPSVDGSLAYDLHTSPQAEGYDYSLGHVELRPAAPAWPDLPAQRDPADEPAGFEPTLPDEPAASASDGGSSPQRFDIDAMLREELAGAGAVHPDPRFAEVANNDDPRMQIYRSAVLDDFSEQDSTDARFISDESEAAISASFAELTQAIRAGELRSLEEMAQELLRPMMREWLEENLAGMVADIVREEIRRAVTRGR